MSFHTNPGIQSNCPLLPNNFPCSYLDDYPVTVLNSVCTAVIDKGLSEVKMFQLNCSFFGGLFTVYYWIFPPPFLIFIASILNLLLCVICNLKVTSTCISLVRTTNLLHIHAKQSTLISYQAFPDLPKVRVSNQFNKGKTGKVTCSERTSDWL